MNLLGYLFTQRFLSDNDSLPSSLRLICPGQGYRLLGQFLFSLLAQINLGGQVGDAQVKLGVHRQKLAALSGDGPPRRPHGDNHAHHHHRHQANDQELNQQVIYDCHAYLPVEIATASHTFGDSK